MAIGVGINGFGRIGGYSVRVADLVVYVAEKGRRG
jgi:hypothetical protein